jgi:hypothetical protein
MSQAVRDETYSEMVQTAADLGIKVVGSGRGVTARSCLTLHALIQSRRRAGETTPGLRRLRSSPRAERMRAEVRESQERGLSRVAEAVRPYVRESAGAPRWCAHATCDGQRDMMFPVFAPDEAAARREAEKLMRERGRGATYELKSVRRS